MAKFTKLNIGDIVASSGGRVWTRLSTGSAEPQDELAGTWFIKEVLVDSGSSGYTDVILSGSFNWYDGSAIVVKNLGVCRLVYKLSSAVTTKFSNQPTSSDKNNYAETVFPTNSSYYARCNLRYYNNSWNYTNKLNISVGNENNSLALQIRTITVDTTMEELISQKGESSAKNILLWFQTNAKKQCPT